MRQTPRAPREVYQKYCLMDVAPAPACRERSIRTSVEEILQKMFSLISHRPLGRSSKKWLMGAAPAPPGGRRETLLKKVFRRISPGTRRICRISTHALVWVEMRQALRPSPEIHKKNLLMDVAPAPAGGGDPSKNFFLMDLPPPRPGRGPHPSNMIFLMDLPQSPWGLSYLEPCALMGVEIRQILRASGEIHQKTIF